ncbi:MAG: hypothetical protein NTW19_01120 [Planctomycetota bacterium]|nr:hypothetical protein [Planctomycetota bacterium]
MNIRTMVVAMSLAMVGLGCATSALAQGERTFRLREGVTALVANPEGKDFTVAIDVRDINLEANGPREVLFKVYDPEGKPVVREVIPDDGCAPVNPPNRIGGFDHDLQSYISLYAKGANPNVRWSAWSDPNRLKTIVARTFERPIKGGKKGVYRIVLAGTSDHFITLRLTPSLQYGFCGHPMFVHGHGDLLKQAFVYVPKGTVGLHFIVAEPDEPRGRRFTLTAPDGKVLYDGPATGGYFTPEPAKDEAWKNAMAAFASGQYDGKLLRVQVSDGPNDYLIKITLQQTPKGAFADYVGMGVNPVFCPDEATANAIQAGTIVVDGDVFWQPFQVRYHNWLKANGASLKEDVRKDAEKIYNGMRLLEASDGRGTCDWNNWAYGMGYYGFKVFKTSWKLMPRGDVSQELKDIIKEGLIMAGDRLSFATGMERVNGNSFSQINVALWYCHRATGDALQKERFETFWQRWSTGGWGPGAGLSPSGDSQEHFAHDMNYGSYIMNNWRPSKNIWVAEGGILGDAGDDPRFQQVMDRYYELYTYLYCHGAAANPWSGRTAASANPGPDEWERTGHAWKGNPGPDLTVNVNGGNEWFAARRRNYYILTFHGHLAPEWMSQCFSGQLGFGGGTICQLTVPGKGPVLASTLSGDYGVGMHPSQWRSFHVHNLVGERWDGFPVVAGISEHHDAKLNGNTVTSSGEIRDAHLKSTRSYTYNNDSIDCAVQLAQSDYSQILSMWTHERQWSEMRSAYEMIPFIGKQHDGKTPTSVKAADGSTITPAGALTPSIRIDRGGFGVEIQIDQPRLVKLGENSTVMIQVIDPAPAGGKSVPAEKVAIRYKLVPFGN